MHLAVFLTAVLVGLSACTATQLEENALLQTGTLEAVRYSQLLTNISQGIDNAAPVPSQAVFSTGQATINETGTLSLTLPAMNFSKNSRSMNPQLQASWQNNWTLSPISDPQDIQNLRALYGLLYHTEDEIAHLIRQTEMQYELGQDKTKTNADLFAPGDCGISWTTGNDRHPYIRDHRKAIVAYFRALDAYPYLAQTNESPAQARDELIKSNCYIYDEATSQPRDPTVARLPPIAVAAPPKNAKQPAAALAAPTPPATVGSPVAQPQKVATFLGTSSNVATSPAATLNLYYGLVYPTPDQVRYVLRSGDSLECRDYETGEVVDRSKKFIAALTTPNRISQDIFVRWLFWKDAQGGWKPYDPPADAPLQSLGTYGGREFWTTARACLNDFIVLAIESTANSHAAAQASPKGTTPSTGP